MYECNHICWHVCSPLHQCVNCTYLCVCSDLSQHSLYSALHPCSQNMESGIRTHSLPTLEFSLPPISVPSLFCIGCIEGTTNQEVMQHEKVKGEGVWPDSFLLESPKLPFHIPALGISLSFPHKSFCLSSTLPLYSGHLFLKYPDFLAGNLDPGGFFLTPI